LRVESTKYQTHRSANPATAPRKRASRKFSRIQSAPTAGFPLDCRTDGRR
jgi:hypothetical protein